MVSLVLRVAYNHQAYLWAWFHLLFHLGSCGLFSILYNFLITLFFPFLILNFSLLPLFAPLLPPSFLEYKLSLIIIPTLLICRISWWKLTTYQPPPETLVYLSMYSGILKSLYLCRLKSIEFVGLLKFNLHTSDAKTKVKIWSSLSNVLIATLTKYNHTVAL